MTGKKKKMAAVLAAVNFYLQQEEATAHDQRLPLMETKTSEWSPWGQSGRQEMMAMRKLIQIRAFTRF